MNRVLVLAGSVTLATAALVGVARKSSDRSEGRAVSAQAPAPEAARRPAADVRVPEPAPRVAFPNQTSAAANRPAPAAPPRINIAPQKRRVPLRIRPYKGTPTDRAIDAGLVPPGYVHSWAIDLKGIQSFRLLFQKKEEIALHWAGGDRLTVLGECGEVLGTAASLKDVQTMVFTLKPCPYMTTCARIYLQLETAPTTFARRFVLAALENQTMNLGAEEAILVEDDLAYAPAGGMVLPVAEAIDANGKPFSLDAPWYVGNSTASGKKYPKPARDDGWFLLGKNLTNNTAGFYHLVYYNEWESKLRFYLYNLSLTQTVTGHEVEVQLRKLAPSGFVPIEGAIFPIDPNPKNWSRAKFVVDNWSAGKWTYLEFPVLYPMAKSLPTKYPMPAGASAQHYRSVYEDEFLPGYKNVQLQITVRGYLEGQANLNFFGTAVGEAIESFDGGKGVASFADYAKKAFEAIQKGGSYYSSSKAFLDKLSSNGALKTLLGSLGVAGSIAAAAPYISAAIAVIGAAISFFQAIFDDPEPLRLSIELALHGKIQGVIVTPLVTRHAEFYLPGRFSIQEALDPSNSIGLSPLNREHVDAVLPRYDRPVGLFGYEYEPWSIHFDMTKSADPITAGWHEFPATSSLSGTQPALGNRVTATIPRLLPAIRNPYAPLVVAGSAPSLGSADFVSMSSSGGQGSGPVVTGLGWSRIVAHVVDPEGMGGYHSGIYLLPAIDTSGGLGLAAIGAQFKPGRHGQLFPQTNVPITTMPVPFRQGYMMGAGLWNPGWNEGGGNFYRLHYWDENLDVIHTWDVKYACRTRAGGDVVRTFHLYSPVMINQVRYEWGGYPPAWKITETLVESPLLTK